MKTATALVHFSSHNEPGLLQVVNMEEKDVVEKLGVPFFGMNLGVGLSLPIPGFRSSVAAGLLDSLPFEASSLVRLTCCQILHCRKGM